MPRLPRIHVDEAVYFVSSRALHGEVIFKDKVDYQMYLELVTKYRTQHQFKLFSYCLLPDRIHLLVETGTDATISDIMHDITSLYTKYFNGRYNRHGHLFEARFKSILVEKVNYLLQMTRHLHQVARDENSVFSSYDLYTLDEAQGNPAALSNKALNISAEIKEVLTFLKEKDNALSYTKYCLDTTSDEVSLLEKKLRRGAVLGSSEFEAHVKNRIFQHVESKKEAAKLATKSKWSKGLLLFFGGAVILASSSSVYLYQSKSNLQTKYDSLLFQKEAEFAEKTKFENRNPLALTDLEGTTWEIELVSLAPGKSNVVIYDRLHFKNGQFWSEKFKEEGFEPTNFSLSKQSQNGVVIWETMQSTASGNSASWRGDWNADAMKGVISLSSNGQRAQEYSFFSVKWSYLS